MSDIKEVYYCDKVINGLKSELDILIKNKNEVYDKEYNKEKRKFALRGESSILIRTDIDSIFPPTKEYRDHAEENAKASNEYILAADAVNKCKEYIKAVGQYKLKLLDSFLEEENENRE